MDWEQRGLARWRRWLVPGLEASGRTSPLACCPTTEHRPALPSATTAMEYRQALSSLPQRAWLARPRLDSSGDSGRDR
ncbi:hypothetical protein E2562_006493 [Oryza meyeriana var. granulata]|uniref:Uncharacterized protein n=1 Tax=Oryza meyeriana var. granulata TaxID=110450 RepID=A0A6G1CNY7_9ORYZ|nr:hypothetical protein E2562_006493 [Oryza meyeriana var. granulata]